uniref:Uncharacterized protein n=1 Tax=Lactuca sativa TaxID=4236 RepID=A0A9R1UQE8_LACSA|nr:hypothetical protein LSAT_V11C800391100 [Lactuca sativa]
MFSFTRKKNKNSKENKPLKQKKSPAKTKTPEKRKLHDSDSDLKKPKKKESPIKKEKKKPMVKECYSMKNRCSPKSLLAIILRLSKQQKECSTSMGFGSMLKMKMTDIPLKLGFYILKKFDFERMVIDVEGKELKVTTQSVHDMLGIPTGGTILTQLDQWPKDDTNNIRYLETSEQEISRFGIGELNEEFVNEQDEGDTDLEDSDCDKDEDDSVETMKEKLNSRLNNAITNNEIGLEGINLTPVMGQKTNDEKEKEDKEGNGEEDNDNDGNYLLDANKVDNEGIKNDGDNNIKKGETKVKEKDGEIIENENDEEKNDDVTEETNNHGDAIVENIVDNVLGIRFSSLNSQEDEIWNDPEMKTILDNIDIGSPMTISKTNTPISQVIQDNGNSEGVHKQGREVGK